MTFNLIKYIVITKLRMRHLRVQTVQCPSIDYFKLLDDDTQINSSTLAGCTKLYPIINNGLGVATLNYYSSLFIHFPNAATVVYVAVCCCLYETFRLGLVRMVITIKFP